MTFGRRGAVPKPHRSYRNEPVQALRAPFNFGGIALAAGVAAISFFVVSAIYVSVFARHVADTDAIRTILRTLMVTPVTALFYLVSFSVSDAILRGLSVTDPTSYALSSLISSCALVALFILATGGGYYIVLAVIAPGGFLGGVMLGRSRRRSLIGAV